MRSRDLESRREWNQKESHKSLCGDLGWRISYIDGDLDEPSSGELSKGLLEQGCLMMYLKLFVSLSYKPPFPDNSWYVSFG